MEDTIQRTPQDDGCVTQWAEGDGYRHAPNHVVNYLMLREDFEGVGPGVSTELKGDDRLFITQPPSGILWRDKLGIVDGLNPVYGDSPIDYLVKVDCVPA